MDGGGAKRHTVHQGGKTFEEHHKDLVSGLERVCGSGDQQVRSVPVDASQWVCSHDSWFPEMSRWIDNARRRMSHDLSVMPHKFFSLEPFELATPHSSLFDYVDDQMDRLRREMDQTLLSLTETPMNIEAPEPVPILAGTAAGELGYLRDAYEPGADGHLYFKTRYNVQDFKPEDISVSTKNNRLIVHGKKTEKTPEGGEVTREFCRSLLVPEKVEKDGFHAHLSSDGVLMVEAPVKEANYHAIKFDNDRQLCVEPSANNQLAITGTDGVMVVGEGDNRRVHLEVPLDAAFEPKDISVKMDANRIVIQGKHEEKTDGEEVHSLEKKKFIRSFMLPQTVDSCAVSSAMRDGRLVVEAPIARF